jgi:hypothetical protein
LKPCLTKALHRRAGEIARDMADSGAGRGSRIKIEEGTMYIQFAGHGRRSMPIILN